jgi:AraC-like DNA-binding protein
MNASRGNPQLFASVLALTLFAQRGLCAGNFDWPRWQGPERTAISRETGLLKEWPKDGPPLGCRVRFKADHNALVFRTSDLDRPFVTHNEELVTMIGTQLDAELKARNASVNVDQQVRETLKRSLAGKRPTLQDVAQELGLSARTLQRRLTDAGITFQQLVEDTRRELAHHYLKQSSVELNEAAFLLGYEDANSFFRAFQMWNGTSPGEWRKAHCQA